MTQHVAHRASDRIAELEAELRELQVAVIEANAVAARNQAQVIKLQRLNFDLVCEKVRQAARAKAGEGGDA